jgi:Holliday junction resolvasome RuvABC endonuclease subunit
MHVGIDYSMTCPAVCAYSPESCKFWFAHESKYDVMLDDVSTNMVSSSDIMARRAWTNAAHVLEWLHEFVPDCQSVTIEDYAYSASGRVFHIGEHTGMLKWILDDHCIRVDAVPPTVVKKFATGKGNADKPKMTAAFLAAYPAAQSWVTKLFPRNRQGASPAKSPLADLADAYWIARYSYQQSLTATK